MNGNINDRFMNGDVNGHLDPITHNYDIIIIGAGISGINAAYRVKTSLPHVNFTVLEGRHELGGTWSLFKYPGIRSDSDLHTYGFPFNPWEKSNPIATGESITEYMQATTRKFDLDKHFTFKHKIMSADWRSSEQKWRLEVDNDGRRKTYWAKFVIMGTGYYDYDKPLHAEIPGLERFRGTRVHPQFWPNDLDYQGKKMIVIGSGATAVSILPAVVENGVGSIVQLQRSPSYVVNMVQPNPEYKPFYQRFLPRSLFFRVRRLQFIIVGYFFYHFCQMFPDFTRRAIRKQTVKQLPKGFPVDPTFKPAYNPWDQRMCLVPDSDFFKALHTGKARIVTDTIKTVVEDGIELNGGEKLDADIIVTATGLNLQVCGGIPLSIDGKPVHVPDLWTWRAAMFSGVPNLATIIGYANASWTLGADTAARLITRLYKYMEDHKYTVATPQIKDEEKKRPDQMLKLTSTYIKAAVGKMPQAGSTGPWKPRSNYFQDSWAADRADLREGMEFGMVAT